MIPYELQIQEEIINKLQNREIYPYSVLFSFAPFDKKDNSGGTLSLTFYLKEDLDNLLDILNYKSQCDKSGWTIIEKNNTVIFTGLALLHLYTNL